MPTYRDPCAIKAQPPPRPKKCCPTESRSVRTIYPNVDANLFSKDCKPCKDRAYTWFSPPHPYSDTKLPCKEQPPSEPLKNLMYDKRVIRGSNYNQSQIIACGEKEWSKEAESRRRHNIRKRFNKNQRGIIGTPPPVCGRKHSNIQTDKYLEELFDRPREATVGAQTDLFLQRPPSPPYIPAKIGVDVATEIGDGDLFDFDYEVQPLLETIVGQSVEQALVEVIHEEELAEIKEQQQELLALREADLAELRRLEAEEIRLQEEKDRRTKQDEIATALDGEMQQRVTAARLLQGHIASIMPDVVSKLEPLNEVSNREELERKLCPWLTEQVAEEVGNIIDSREILSAIIREILKQRAQTYEAMFDGITPEPQIAEEEMPEEDEYISEEEK